MKDLYIVKIVTIINSSFIFLLFITLSTPVSYSQSTDKYFDDGNISNAKNVLKYNVLSTFNGNPSLHYERVLTDAISIEVGAGIILPYYTFEYVIGFDDDLSIPESGSSFTLFPKYYRKGDAPDRGYWGLEIRQRNYTYSTFKNSYLDLSTKSGIQYNVLKRMVIDIDYGVGLRLSKSNQNSFGYENIGYLVSAGIKLGFLF